MKKSLVLLLVLAMMAVSAVLVACGDEGTTETTAAGDSGTGEVARSILVNPQGLPADSSVTPKVGGTMNVIVGMTLSNIGAPWAPMPGPNLFFARFACEMLTGQNTDGSPAPQLATSWDIDPEAMTYTLYLREGVNFQDGTPFNAEAVVWNLGMSKDAGTSFLQNVVSIEATDIYTVVITLADWDSIFLNELGDTAGMMVSPTAYEEYGDGIKTHPVGTGPFEFVSFIPDASVEFKAFDGYWQEGLPYLDGVNIDMVTDATTRFAAFLNGECDFLEGITGAQVKEAQEQGYGSSLFMVSGIIGITWDSTSADSPFSDIRVRRAIAMAAPYAEIVEGVFSGMYPTTNQFAAQIEVNGTIMDMAGYDSSITGYEYDEAAALALMEEAGYGLDNPINCKLTYQQQAEKDDEYTALQEYFAQIGVNIELVSVDSAAWGEYYVKQEVGQMCDWETSYQLAIPYPSTLGVSLSPGASLFPLQSYPPEYDALYQTMMAETDDSVKADLCKQLNKMAVDDFCIALPLYCKTNYKGIGSDLRDMGCGQLSGEYDPSIIWLDR